MSEVFADSFYYLALLNPSDRFHTALQATNALNRQIVTTLWVLMEVADALSAPAVRRRTHQFLHRAGADANTVVIMDKAPWFSRGVELFGKRLDKSWSLTDCISFEVMADRGILEALTGDHHFIQAGFRTLLPSKP
jgi:predicted nucleic acid-binding protein